MITNLRIENFKCFCDQSVTFKPLTVLAGPNGVGKSTVIQSLLMLRQSVNCLAYSKSKADPRILLNGPFLLSLGSASEILNSESKSDRISFEVSSAHGKTILFEYIAKESDLSIVLRREGIEFEKNGELPFGEADFHYLNAERVGPKNVQEIVDQEFLNTGYRGEYTGQVIAKAETLNKIFDENDKRIRVYNSQILLPLKKQIEAWMDFIIPHIEIKLEPFPTIYSVRVSLRNKSSKTGFLHPSNIGFGITYSLPIVVSGLIAAKGATFIIENPEAHLHPGGQSRIGQFLAQIAAAGIQVIVETHSEHVINGIRIAMLNKILESENILINFFSQSEKQSTPSIDGIQINERGELSSWPKGFFDQEQLDLANIFRLSKQS